MFFSVNVFIGPNIEYKPESPDLFSVQNFNNIKSYQTKLETSFEYKYFSTDVETRLVSFSKDDFNLENVIFFNANLPLKDNYTFSIGLGFQTTVETPLLDSQKLYFTIGGADIMTFFPAVILHPEILLSTVRIKHASHWYFDNSELMLCYYAQPSRIGKKITGGTFYDILKSGSFSVCYKYKVN